MPAMVGGFGSKKILMVYLKIAQRHIYKINFSFVLCFCLHIEDTTLLEYIRDTLQIGRVWVN